MLRLFMILLTLVALPAQSEQNLTRIRMGQQGLQIIYDESLNRREQQRLYRWIERITGDFTIAFGQLPRDRIRIRVETTPANEPVPWGQVNRKATNEILFVVDPDFSFDDFASDWTAYHEFSHLLIPYQGSGDLWLSEGLASYYQNLIQGRAGRFTEHRMWEKLVAGLERGQNSRSYRDTRLVDVSDSLTITNQQMRIHWSGVLYWLTMDATLRQQGHPGLDFLLTQLKDCCQLHTLNARQIIKQLDRLSNMDLFEPQFDHFRNSYLMPDHHRILNKLGVQRNSWFGGIRFEDTAEWAEVRRQLILPATHSVPATL